ncbi:ATP-dependent helicase [Actinokineospora pegani]|uniref:ATP-dependent helicase n=1 Tax=Actinokineospora pegani TaxID=2654637 RepID=UPI0012EAE062|nr:ATP-dependent helicase [Actinokineospora pegani]
MGTLTDSINDLRTNKQQWEAFSHRGHCVVLAPPGSGKTKLLTTRLAHDLFNRIPEPHGAACITLTNAAARQLQRRIEALGAPRRSTLFVGTVHSFALRQVLLPFASLTGKADLLELGIASDRQERSASHQAVNEVFGKMRYPDDHAKEIQARRRRFTVAPVSDSYTAAGLRYRELLRGRGLMDFDEVVEAAVDIVEGNPVVRDVLMSRYRNLYVDEYQDLVPGLDRLLRSLCLDAGTAELFAVGDPEQALYGWAGSNPELLFDLAAQEGVHPVHLEHNYRCGHEIIRVANLIQRGHAMVGDNQGGAVTVTHCPGGFADQCANAVTAVQRATTHGTALHDIVVLCSTNRDCEQAAQALRDNGIAAFVRESGYRLTLATALVEKCASWAALGQELSDARLGTILRDWRKLLSLSWTPQHDTALVKALLGFSSRVHAPAATLLDELEELGLDGVTRRRFQAEDARELRNMRDVLSDRDKPLTTVNDLAERVRRSDRVEVTTMTSSKGLEFDVVLILGMDEKCLPHFKSMDDAARMNEDRRKFFVSVTRAKNEVHIFYSGFVQWASGSVAQAGPSRFLHEAGLI